MADEEYIIKTKYSESFEFVYVKKEELSYENYVLNGNSHQFNYIYRYYSCFVWYLFAAAKVFKVERDLDFKVRLKANNSIVLTKSNFNRIVEYFSRCACFQIIMQMEVKIMPDVVITPDVSPDNGIRNWNFDWIWSSYSFQNIENYLIDNNADKAILEEREGDLSLPTRRFLITHLANYVTSVHGMDVPRAKLVPFCEAVLDVFPSLNLGNAKEKNIVSEQQKRKEAITLMIFLLNRICCVIRKEMGIYRPKSSIWNNKKDFRMLIWMKMDLVLTQKIKEPLTNLPRMVKMILNSWKSQW